MSIQFAWINTDNGTSEPTHPEGPIAIEEVDILYVGDDEDPEIQITFHRTE